MAPPTGGGTGGTTSTASGTTTGGVGTGSVGGSRFTIIIGIGIVLVPIWWIVAAYDAYKQVIKRDQRYGYAQSNPYFFVSRPTLCRPSKLTL